MATKAKKKTAHFTLQGKGGVGKSLVSVLLAQYLRKAGEDVKCIDTDPVNQSFTGYKALDVQFLKLIEDGSTSINSRNFDSLMERLLSEDGSFIVDNGAASFLPISNYMVENNAIEMIESAGRDVYIHTVITGGQSLRDTVSGFVALARQTTIKRIVIWLNEFFGPIEHQGKAFNEMKAYLDHTDKIHGIVRIPRRNQDTFAADIEQMIKSHHTFGEVLNDPAYSLMAKSRLKRVQDEIFEQLSGIGF